MNSTDCMYKEKFNQINAVTPKKALKFRKFREKS